MFSESRLKQLHWQHYERVPNLILPAPWRAWVLDRGSLTQRLILASGGHFHVHVIAQRLGQALPDERRILDLPDRTACVIREVALMCFDEPWVFARSIVPVTTLTGTERQLARLGSRPLGALLFRSPSMSRGPLELARFEQPFCAPEALGTHQGGFGRRSVFRLHNKPLLVSEFFTQRVLQQRPD